MPLGEATGEPTDDFCGAEFVGAAFVGDTNIVHATATNFENARLCAPGLTGCVLAVGHSGGVSGVACKSDKSLCMYVI